MLSILREQFNAALPLLAGTIAASVFSYVAVTLSARLLGAADYGLLGTLLGITSVGTVALRPLHSAATHAASTAFAHRDQSVVHAFAGKLLAVCVVGAVLLCLATVVLEPAIGDLLHIGVQDQRAPTLVAVLLASLAFWQGMSGLALGMQRFSQYALATVLDAAVRAAAIVPLVIQFGVAGALAGYTIGSAAANVVTVRALGGLSWRPTNARIDGYQLARVSGDWILLTFLVAGLQNLDLVLLRSYAAAEQVGWYAAAATLSNLTFTLASPLYAPLYPRLVSRVREGKPTRLLLLGTLVPLVVAGAIGILITAWVGGPITRLLFGDEFTSSGALLPDLLVKTTALLTLLIVGQYAIALRRSQAVVACSIPSILTLISIAVLHFPAEQVALVTGLGAASAALVAGLLLVQANATRQGR